MENSLAAQVVDGQVAPHVVLDLLIEVLSFESSSQGLRAEIQTGGNPPKSGSSSVVLPINFRICAV